MTHFSTLVLAHRGASHHYPPNTLDAFRGALVLGADGVELDVQLTRDAVAVVHHDATLVDGRLIRSLSYAELPVWVPTLDASLAACEGLSLINVELKTRAEDDPDERCSAIGPVLTSVERAGAADRVLLSSFDLEVLDAAARRGGLPTAHLVVDPGADGSDAVGRAAEHGHVAVNPWYGFVDQDLVDRAHDLGLAVHPWTVDDPTRMTGLLTLGVDSLITNRPDVARAVLAGR